MNCQLNFSYSYYIIHIDRGMEEATFAGSPEEIGAFPFFYFFLIFLLKSFNVP
jgi:hypothetical protein